jgi:small-conductance mechanosensitive channel
MKISLSRIEFGRRTIIALLALLFIGLLIAGFETQGGDQSLEYNAPPALPNTSGLVDQKPLQTARALAAQAATLPEQQFADEAVRLADHEVDQAFATALRLATADAANDTKALKGKALAISQHIRVAEQRIREDQQQVDDLTAALQKAVDKDDAQQDLDLAKAQLALDGDELSDLHQDLIRAGGDKHARIQQALDEHEAVLKQSETVTRNALIAALESPEGLSTLPGKFRARASLSDRHRQLLQARADALGDAAVLSRQHDDLEKKIELDAASTPSGATRTATLDHVHAVADERRTLADFNSRVEDELNLAADYQSWDTLVVAQKRTVIHRIIRVFSVILIILIAVVAIGSLIRRFFDRDGADLRRLHHLRLVVELGVQVCGVLLVLLIIFGPPQQFGTILGLATAGLTVVLKDFIVAFIGWFALMGKNGMRIGDWVEINGVSGEVIEISLFRTILLETGNWTDAGQPTGRRVSFLNGYAIEGQYFNFSTAGQWLWDELRVTVPAVEDTYRMVDEIRSVVESTTSPDARLAEQEWKKATHTYSGTSFSAESSVDLRPVPEGIQVIIRYITRAPQRFDVRSHLYQDVINILHPPLKTDATATPAADSGKSEIQGTVTDTK